MGIMRLNLPVKFSAIISLFLAFLCALYFVGLLVFPAFADEPRNSYKLTCIPELNYLEVTSVFTNKEISPEVKSKYNIGDPRTFSCLINNQLITLKFERIRNDAVSGEQIPTYTMAILSEGKPVGVIEHFGSFKKDAPHILTYDGFSISACHGYDDRACETFRRNTAIQQK